MEGKDMHSRMHSHKHSRTPILELLKENVRRETEEEAHITEMKKLRHTGLVFQSQEHDYPPNHFFQYHIFQAFASPKTIETAFEEFDWIHEHPKAFARMRRDVVEKDDMAWFNPRRTRMMGRWSPSIVAQYLSAMK
jgi:predicted NUDIX family phosphoesterase